MAVSSAQKSSIVAQIARIDAQIIKANDTYDTLLASPAESYKFDSGEGSQQTKNRKLSEMEDTIDRLNIRRARLVSQLNCSGIINQRLSRRGGHHGF